MSRPPKPPGTYRDFRERFPRLGEAWDTVRRAEAEGPIDKRTARLVKLAVAAGVQRPGAVSSATRKAHAAGASEEEIYQVVALAASTLGFPSTVAVFSWVRDALAGMEEDGDGTG